jgi:hypothetical protein
VEIAVEGHLFAPVIASAGRGGEQGQCQGEGRAPEPERGVLPLVLAVEVDKYVDVVGDCLEAGARFVRGRR